MGDPCTPTQSAGSHGPPADRPDLRGYDIMNRMDAPMDLPMDVPMPGSIPGRPRGSLSRASAWTAALGVALVLALAWILVPGKYVVQAQGTADHVLARTVLLSLLRPFEGGWVYLFDIALAIGPIVLVLLSFAHWRRKVTVVRLVSAGYALLFSFILAFHPARRLEDLMLIGVVGVWAIVLLLAFRSKASPGAALIALLALQMMTIEAFVGLGSYRGIPYYCLMGCLVIVFAYGLLHYTRKLRHSILGRFTTIRRRPPPAYPRRELEGDHWKT